MRVTENRLIDQGLRGAARARNQVFQASNELSSGQRVRKPSDDPAAWAQGQRLAAALAETEARTRSSEAGRARLVESDLRLQEMGEWLNRARELAVQLGNGTISTSERQAAARGLVELRDAVLSVANAKDAEGRYLFAGTETQAAPFAPDGSYLGDTAALLVTTGAGATVSTNVQGSELVSATAGSPVQAIDTLVNAALADDAVAIRAATGTIGAAVDQLAEVRSGLGHRMALLEEAASMGEDQRVRLSQALSDAVGADALSAAEAFVKARSALETAQALNESLASILRRPGL